MAKIKLVYEQIKEYIKEEALLKCSGEALNTEVGYSNMFSVSRPTVRKAVGELVEEGIVQRIPGKGLEVAGKDILNKNSAGELAFILPYVPEDGFFYNILMGCIDTANKWGYNYSVLKHTGNENILDQIKSGSFIGAILTDYKTEMDQKIIKYLNQNNIPYVLVDNADEDTDTSYVVTDDYKGSYMAAEYLISKGHKKILYLTIDNNAYTVNKRLKGYLDALRDNKIKLSLEYTITLHKDEDIINILPKINLNYTAICGYSDLPVIMAYNTLLHMGVKIPKQVSLFGYGNYRASELLYTPLNTISVPVYEIGEATANMLINNIEGRSALQRIMLDVELIERKSVTDAIILGVG